jgi:single-stranded-DNA-specific exonuclease
MGVVEPRFRWVFPPPIAVDPDLASAASVRGLSDRFVRVLAARGVTDRVSLDAWFADPLDALHDPRRLPDIDRLLDRLATARTKGERVLVFGDFDADGLTGLAILVIALRRYGLAVEPYVPSRLEEGHGLSLAAVETAERTGATVIITVDCGTTSHAEIAAAVARGIDVIVTDHHRVPPELPPALAVVNPHRADATYPDRRLAGSGVAFKVAQALLADEPGGPMAALALADLATIGSVADVAPVVGENRAIARLGLERLRSAPRPGIAALLARSRVEPAAVDLETVAFALAPRLNAAGRVGDGWEAARLLLAETVEDADRHADALEAANLERRDLMKRSVADARTMVDENASPSATIVKGPWSVGIVGLVAARLAEDLGRPAVVGAELGDVVRASCRSDGSLDLGATLEQCADLFTRFGGHAGAAGFELPADRWDTFRARFLDLAANAAPRDPRMTLQVDLATPALGVDYALLRELAGLAPTGPGNPDPLIAVLGLTVTRVREANGGHSQLTLRRSLDVLDGIAFGRPDLAETVHEGDVIDVVARLVSRTFGGFETLQLEIRDAATAGMHDEAIRTAKIASATSSTTTVAAGALAGSAS